MSTEKLLNDRVKDFVTFLKGKTEQTNAQETPEENRIRGVYKALAWFGDVIQKTREEVKAQLDTRNEQLVKEILGILERFKQEIIAEVIKILAEAGTVNAAGATAQTPAAPTTVDGIPVQVPQPIPAATATTPENK